MKFIMKVVTKQNHYNEVEAESMDQAIATTLRQINAPKDQGSVTRSDPQYVVKAEGQLYGG